MVVWSRGDRLGTDRGWPSGRIPSVFSLISSSVTGTKRGSVVSCVPASGAVVSGETLSESVETGVSELSSGRRVCPT